MRCSLLLTFAACLLEAAPASACRIQPPPVIPFQGDPVAVATATVISGDEYGAVARLDEVIDGDFYGPTVALDYVTREGDAIIIGSCGPPGPRVEVGARVVVVFGPGFGWVTLDAAVHSDEFIARYLRETSPARKEALRQHWHQVNLHHGPVPLTDPAQWMPPYVGGLGWAGVSGLSYVQFRIDDRGRIAHCAFLTSETLDPRNATICARVAGRRFLPPMFAREREGLFWVHWSD